jgi:hypothetical protein
MREFRLSPISWWPTVFIIWRVYVNSFGPDKTLLISTEDLFRSGLLKGFDLKPEILILWSCVVDCFLHFVINREISASRYPRFRGRGVWWWTGTLLIATSVCCPFLSPTHTAGQLEPRTFLEGKAVSSQSSPLSSYKVDPMSGLRMPELNQN